MNSTELVLESFLETQLKLKVLHLNTSEYLKDINSLDDIKKNTIRLFLKVLYSVTLKKVLSCRITNRITLKFFKSFVFTSASQKTSILSRNKSILDKCYVTTVAINSLYECYAKESSY